MGKGCKHVKMYRPTFVTLRPLGSSGGIAVSKVSKNLTVWESQRFRFTAGRVEAPLEIFKDPRRLIENPRVLNVDGGDVITDGKPNEAGVDPKACDQLTCPTDVVTRASIRPGFLIKPSTPPKK